MPGRRIVPQAGAPVEWCAAGAPAVRRTAGAPAVRRAAAALVLAVVPAAAVVGLGGAPVPAAAQAQNAPVTRPLTEAQLAQLQQQVFAAERAFARSMAERRHEDFVRHLADDALFYSGPKGSVLRGKAAVAAAWKRFYEGPDAPFSWEPDQVDVLADGTLALSTGPVRDAAGKLIARFNSVWRQEAPGVWRVVIDKGSPPDPGAP